MDVDLSNPVELMKIFDQADQGVIEDAPDEDAAKADEIVKDGAPDKEAAVDRQQEEGQGQAESQPEKEPEGIATKDGKHVIPYSVLKSERDRAAKAEQLAKEASARIADLTAQLETAKQGAKPGERARTDLQQGDTESLSDEELEFLKDDNPAVYKALKAIEAKATQLQERLKPVETKAKEIEADKAEREAELVQSAIDSIPKLAHIQSANAEAYALAQQFDTTLQGLKEWANKPLSERFAKAVQMVEDAIGPIEIPQASNPSLKPEDLKAAAKAKAAEASKASRTSVPTSLSEFPAGRAPATDEREALESLSHTQLAAKMARMTPEQLDAYLQNL
jgi:hypothetical protein